MCQDAQIPMRNWAVNVGDLTAVETATRDACKRPVAKNSPKYVKHTGCAKIIANSNDSQ